MNKRELVYLKAQGVAEVVLGRNTPDYKTTVNACLASDGRFMIRLDNHTYYRGSNVDFSYDGADYFYVIRGEILQDGWFKGGLAYLTSGIEEPSMFDVQDDVRDSLWLTLLSGGFLRNRGLSGEIPNLFLWPRRSVVAHGFRYETELVNSCFPMPRTFALFRDKSLDRETRDEEEWRAALNLTDFRSTVRGKQWQEKEKWHNGSCAVDLRWDGSTNLEDGVVVPSDVTVAVYHPFPCNGFPFRRVRVQFTSWEMQRKEVEPSFRPEIDQGFAVLDYRLRMRDGQHYVDQAEYRVGAPWDLEWRSKEDPVIRDSFKSRISQLPKR